MTRVRLALALALVLATPVLANNDPTVPADECSGNPKVVGQPFGFNAVDIGPSPVQGPASRNNPGQSTGAKGQASSAAIGHCNP